MINTRTAVIVALGLVLSTYALQGQDRSRYRDFQLGRDLTTVSALARIAATDAKTIHLRPAVIQELEWRPGYLDSGSISTQTDAVRQIVFRVLQRPAFQGGRRLRSRSDGRNDRCRHDRSYFDDMTDHHRKRR